ncbi:2-dehydropantoate 2-reductase N-terminal domain-containing protein [Streptomyces huasconensis]|uniref:2-dehydropantoate 2-reductase N-terminal domain-containing protein n=1 Tax=Streptomyces huasconensis TaxID=1854574 RepID=UPI0036FD10D8
MKVAVVGAGGIGGCFGGRHAPAGHDVQFVARGCHPAPLRYDGLTVEGPTDVFGGFPAAGRRAEAGAA